MGTLEDFINRTRGVSDLELLRDIFQESLEQQGYAFFAYNIARVAGVGAHLTYFITTYPDAWVTQYLAENYFAIDPVVHEGARQRLPFMWSDVAPLHEMTPQQRRFFDEAARFGIRGGITIPIHGRDGALATMTLAPAGTEAEQRATIVRTQHMVHQLSLYYHAHAAPYLLERFLRQATPELTAMQKDVLEWMTEGQTTFQIARRMGVSERDIRDHVDAAKQKLGVSSQVHLLVKASMEGLIAG